MATRAVMIGTVASSGLFAFVAIRPTQPWILWLTAALVALAIDGTVRAHDRWLGPGRLDSVVYLFLPFLATLGIGFFIDHAIEGYLRIALALAGGAAVSVVAFGEFQTVDYRSRLYGPMRLALAVATYLTAFALYAVIFAEVGTLALGALAVGGVSMALSMELLRESRLVGPSSLVVGLAIGLSLAELRLALYFFPLDHLLGGALLLVGFYLATGIAHHLLDHDLDWTTAAEYGFVAAVGTAAVVFTSVIL